MAKTVVGVFSNYSQAEEVARQLEDQGFSRSDVSVVANDEHGEHTGRLTGEGSHAASGAGTGAAIGGAAGIALGLVALAIPGIGPVIALGPIATALTGAGIGAAAGGLIGAMTNMGVPEEDAHHYSSRVKEGEALVVVNAPDNRAQSAATLLERYGADQVDERQPDTVAHTTATDRHAEPLQARQGENVSAIPVIQEDLEVGKRQVARGGIRVYSHVVEQPVTQQVELREEKVVVDRHPVNREVPSSDLGAFREGTIEVNTVGEEAVVGKRARVVEEVTLRKDASEHTETVRDTLRHTEVEVEKLSGADTPAYRYGSELANDPRYTGRDWTQVESAARSDWESRGSGSWDTFKESIREGWDKVRGRR